MTKSNGLIEGMATCIDETKETFIWRWTKKTENRLSYMILISNFHSYRQGYQMFGVKLSFVATRSGLIRWTDHIAHDPASADP